MVGLFDAVRVLDGLVGHGTLVGALARLELLRLVDASASVDETDGARAYRLTGLGAVVRGAAATLEAVFDGEVSCP